MFNITWLAEPKNCWWTEDKEIRPSWFRRTFSCNAEYMQKEKNRKPYINETIYGKNWNAAKRNLLYVINTDLSVHNVYKNHTFYVLLLHFFASRHTVSSRIRVVRDVLRPTKVYFSAMEVFVQDEKHVLLMCSSHWISVRNTMFNCECKKKRISKTYW